MKNMKIGAQLYTVRMYTQNERDFERTIARVEEMGYETVQLSAIGAGLKPEWIRKVCDKHHLEIALTHTNQDRIMNDTEKVIEEHRIMGCRYIGLGMMAEKYRSTEWMYHFYEDFAPAAEKIAKAGMLFMYHNHNFEFRKMPVEGASKEPRRVLDYLAEWFAPELMGFTLDTYWVQAAGADVCQWVKNLKDRIPCVHFKDMAVTANGSVMAPVGEGNINFKAVVDALQDTCCEHILVEQDICETSPFDCLRMSREHIRELGY